MQHISLQIHVCRINAAYSGSHFDKFCIFGEKSRPQTGIPYICNGFSDTLTEAAKCTDTNTRTYSRHDVTPRPHTQSKWQTRCLFNHINLLLVLFTSWPPSFGFIKNVLHIGKVKVAASRPTKDVENIAARCFKVTRRIVACRHVDLSAIVKRYK